MRELNISRSSVHAEGYDKGYKEGFATGKVK